MRFTVFAASLLLATAADAAIVYNNGAPNLDGGNDATAWIQAEDFMLESITTLTGAGVYLAGFGDLANWDGNLRWWIFDNSNGPGAILATGLVNPPAVDSGLPWCCGGNAYLVEFSFNFTASAGTTYWLGIHASADGDYARDDIYWVTTDQNSSLGGHESAGGTLDNWTDLGNQHAFFLTAVPEAATWAMMIAGFGFVGGALRRRAPLAA